MAIPEKPISRIEHYLARANGQNVTPPDPISRIEHYLAGIAGGVPQELLDDVAELKSQMSEKAPAIMQTVTDQAIASFSDGADDMPLKSLTVAINPVQAGTGDPSPENVRPITGWSAVNAHVRGVNQWDEEWENGYINNSTGEFVESQNYICSKNFIPIVPGTSYYIKSPVALKLIAYDANKTFIRAIVSVWSNEIVVGSTYLSDVYYIKIYNAGSGSLTTYNHDISINYPATDTTYHPYEGGNYITDLGQTVYGGTLDVVSGVLTVTHKAVNMGNLSWSPLGGNGVFGSVITDIYNRERNTPNNAACEAFTGQNEWLAASLTDGHFMIRGDTKTVYFRNNNFTDDAESFKESVSNVTFVYALQTAITYQLTPVEVKTLLGQNNIFADTGSVTVVYPADTKTYIDSQIAALQALVLENISNS